MLRSKQLLPNELIFYILKIKSHTAWAKRKRTLWRRLSSVHITEWEVIHFQRTEVNVLKNDHIEITVEEKYEPLNLHTFSIRAVLKLPTPYRKPRYVYLPTRFFIRGLV